ncbi:MAG: succinate dehydrogenase assembly factor 2 [Betaproteobacteria bacterium]|nr:succinate dehydrogenase assembly factor 2 [Betaproteobacteria bacterium]
MSELDRVRWHCRRGMLELDLLLHRFVDRHLPNLSPDDMTRFKEILDLQDGELWQVLSGRAEIEDRRLQPLVQMIRGSADTREAILTEKDTRL